VPRHDDLERLKATRENLARLKATLHPGCLVYNGPTDPCLSHEAIQAALVQRAINSLNLSILYYGDMEGPSLIGHDAR
jgi:hypothetical protein